MVNKIQPGQIQLVNSALLSEELPETLSERIAGVFSYCKVMKRRMKLEIVRDIIVE